jgi:hypothetical protein
LTSLVSSVAWSLATPGDVVASVAEQAAQRFRILERGQ